MIALILAASLTTIPDAIVAPPARPRHIGRPWACVETFDPGNTFSILGLTLPRHECIGLVIEENDNDARPTYTPDPDRPVPGDPDPCDCPGDAGKPDKPGGGKGGDKPRPGKPGKPDHPGKPSKPQKPGGDKPGKPDKPAGQNPGNGKPVGNAPFDGERGEVPSGKPKS